MPGLAVAGAWTDTGWPATMEGAVRSGHAAASVALDRLASMRDVSPARPAPPTRPVTVDEALGVSG
jgi:hypothetical protein